jgi:hypothetical protein
LIQFPGLQTALSDAHSAVVNSGAPFSGRSFRALPAGGIHRDRRKTTPASAAGAAAQSSSHPIINLQAQTNLNETTD